MDATQTGYLHYPVIQCRVGKKTLIASKQSSCNILISTNTVLENNFPTEAVTSTKITFPLSAINLTVRIIPK